MKVFVLRAPPSFPSKKGGDKRSRGNTKRNRELRKMAKTWNECYGKCEIPDQGKVKDLPNTG